MKHYRGDQTTEPSVVVIQGDQVYPLLIIPYPYERQASQSASIAWWRNHDAAIRLAASLLTDATNGVYDPYTLEVITRPRIAQISSEALSSVTTYLARAFAYEIVSGFAPSSFDISQQDIHKWLSTKAVAIHKQ